MTQWAAAYLALELDLLVVAVWCVPLGQTGLAPDHSMSVSKNLFGSQEEWTGLHRDILAILDQDEGQHLYGSGIRMSLVVLNVLPFHPARRRGLRCEVGGRGARGVRVVRTGMPSAGAALQSTFQSFCFPWASGTGGSYFGLNPGRCALAQMQKGGNTSGSL